MQRYEEYRCKTIVSPDYFKFVTNVNNPTKQNALSAADANNILVVFEGKNIKIVNAFKPGAMPFLITSTFPEVDVAAIETINAERRADNAVYNLNGQRVASSHKGLVIKNGKKFFRGER